MTVVVEDEPPPGEGRATRGLIALYAFQEGAGGVIRDTSGAGEALDLAIADPSAVSWGAGALEVRSPVEIVSRRPAEKIREAVAATGELTIEAWIAPADAVQGGPARIVTISAGLYARSFTLGHGWGDGRPSDVFDVRLRTTETDTNGRPSIATAPGTASPRLRHVAYARDAAGEVRLYIDGELRIRSRIAGTLANWDSGHLLALADEIGGGRPWRGTYRLVAIYGVALTGAEVARNWEAGADGGGPPLFIRGDANGDGAVDLGDAVSILQFVFDGAAAPSACLASLDVDGDGRIGIGDAIRLLAFLFDGGAPPVPPFPGPPAPCP